MSLVKVTTVERTVKVTADGLSVRPVEDAKIIRVSGTGPQGPAGQTVTPAGAWTAQAYSAYSVVSYQGSSYLNATAATSSDVPGTSSKWTLLASKGDTGSQGPAGSQGIQGPAGAASTVPGPKGDKGDTGATGKGITSIARTSGTGAAGTTDTFTITYSDSSTSTFQVYNGANGSNGSAGRGITSIARTSGTGAAGTTDTYTITYSDSTTSTFSVVNGSNGTNGTNGTNGRGISTISKTGTSGKVDTYTVTYTDATTSTFTVTNGNDGTNGTNGTNGRGISTISRTSGTGAAGTTDTYTITFTDSTTSTFTVVNGANGATGSKGAPGAVGMTWQGTWSSSTAYAIGDAVIYSSVYYACTNPRSATATTPNTDTGFWQPIDTSLTLSNTTTVGSPTTLKLNFTTGTASTQPVAGNHKGLVTSTANNSYSSTDISSTNPVIDWNGLDQTMFYGSLSGTRPLLTLNYGAITPAFMSFYTGGMTPIAPTQTGDWLSTSPGTTADMSAAPTSGLEYATPVMFPYDTRIDQIAVRTGTGTWSSTAVGRIGIRSSNNGRPSTLLRDCGTTATNGSAAICTASTFASPYFTFTAGVLYFLTLTTQGTSGAPATPPTYRYASTATMTVGNTLGSAETNPATGYVSASWTSSSTSTTGLQSAWTMNASNGGRVAYGGSPLFLLRIK